MSSDHPFESARAGIDPSSSRWRTLSEPRYPHEHDTQVALACLPDRDPVRVWTGFEFEDVDGALHRLDALVITALGIFAVRTLRLAGRVEGDEQHWTVRRLDGRVTVMDHPLPALRRTTQALTALLAAHGADFTHAAIEPLAFLPEEQLTLQLPHPARLHVVTQDEGASRFTLAEALLQGRYPGSRRHGLELLRPSAAASFTAAVDAALRAGVLRRPDGGRKVGDYRLEHILFEGPTFQDFLGVHIQRGDRLRIRRFNQATRATAEAREQVDRAARREHELLQGLDHPGVVPLLGRRASEFGPCLLYPDVPGARRLDHHIAVEGHRLEMATRLRLLVQLADTLRFAHGEGIVVRALSPQAVLVTTPDRQPPRAAIFTWHAGARRTQASAGLTSTGTQHVPRLLDDHSHLYLAPEVRTGVPVVDEASDVFSLGVLACYVLSGRPPVASVIELTQQLQRQGGLALDTLVDGLPAELGAAIFAATRPVPADRCALDVLAHAFEVALARTTATDEVDPLEAPPGTQVDGWVLERTLGRGATGVALLATTPGGEHRVLKVARTAADADRLAAEESVLRRLDCPEIVRSHGLTDLGERRALVLDRAGSQTLREALRESVGEELAANLGSDLLNAVGHYLDRGVLHRDLKPENLGVGLARREGHERKRLTLFDFSLAGLPPTEVRVGTPLYRDPFLAAGGRPWDVGAELYAAGLVLHELIAGTLPVWGDGSTSIEFVTEPWPRLHAERFPAGVRAPLLAFFQKALHRDPGQRFTDAPSMKAAWRSALQAGALTTPTQVEARTDTPLVDLGLSPRVLNALERLGVRTAGALARIPRNRVALLPGVGAATRAELLQLLARVAPLAAQAAGEAPPAPDPTAISFEAIYDAARRGYRASQEVREAYLGLTPGPSVWPSASELAQRGLNSLSQINKLLQTERTFWQSIEGLPTIADELVGLIEDEGGALPPEALAEALRLARHEPPEARSLALAVARMAVEIEATTAAPRLHLVRSEARVVVATDPERVAWAWQLGALADALAERRPLPEATEALAALRAVDPALALPADKLLRLAAGFSRRAAVTPRHELYPRDLAPEIALLMARLSVLAPGDALTPAELRARVAARFPAAAPLPDGPELIELVRRTGLPLSFSASQGRFVLEAPSSTRLPASSATSLGMMGFAPALRRLEDTQAPEAQRFDDWLTHAGEPGAWAIITTRLRTHEAAVQALTPRATTRIDVEARLLALLEAEARTLRVPFATLLKADARPPTSIDRQRLQVLVDAACARLQAELIALPDRVILLHRVGLLARYGRLDVLEALRAHVQRAGSEHPRAAWVVIPTQHERGPVLDGQPLPHVTRAQVMRVPGVWLEAGA